VFSKEFHDFDMTMCGCPIERNIVVVVAKIGVGPFPDQMLDYINESVFGGHEEQCNPECH
jgi:hypothetical protein